MTPTATACTLERRREDVRQAPLYGLDYVEVGPSQTMLEVFFLGRAPPGLEAANVTISGGRPVRVTGLRLNRQHDLTLDDWMEIEVDEPGDSSLYTLALVQLDDHGRPTGKPLAGLDPIFGTATFTFKASCPSDLDCKVPQICPPPGRPQPDINYLAKDYGSFLQLIRDRLAQTMPDWQETHAPDIGVMLTELLAYVGDQLSYYQEAVAAEAYLGTARQRISIRRHARLVDYRVHEGCNARAWIVVNLGPPSPGSAATTATISLPGFAAGTPPPYFFTTAFPGARPGHVQQWADFLKAPPGSCDIFEPLLAEPSPPIVLRAAHNEIPFYTWGDCACCLPKGVTGATLLDAWVEGEGDDRRRALALRPNDVLVFEEVIGPHTGNPADADPTHRQAVRLTRVTPDVDPLYDRDAGGRPVLRIEWCSEDALGFPLCLSAVMPPPDCTCREGISVARGNVILVDDGLTIGEPLGTVPTASTAVTCATDCEPASVSVTPGRFCWRLKQSPLTFAQALPACFCAGPVVTQDPRRALPCIELTGVVATATGTATTVWTPVPDLLASGPEDTVFVVEVDDAGEARLRFGNGDEGRRPEAGAVFSAQYRVGNGSAGNVGAETIVYLVLRETIGNLGDLVPRNPLPAAGGTAPEPTADVRLFAPYAFRDVLERAVTADDYAALAADNARRLAVRPNLMSARAPVAPPSGDGDRRADEEEEPGEAETLPPDICLVPFRRLQGAKGTLRWNGSWYEALVAADRLGTETADSELLAEIAAYLEPYRRIGHDLAVRPPDYVALDLGLSVCVLPGHPRGQVEGGLRAVLGTGVLADGTPALFNPDKLTFGQGVYLSPIVAAAQAIPGVMEVEITRLAPYLPSTPAPTATPDQMPKTGVLALGPFQIARLDNDPNAPANGRLTLLLRGGR
ncbi:MAG TPA: hypothetical protein VGF50_12395 [Caulobacteraceae bacterium]